MKLHELTNHASQKASPYIDIWLTPSGFSVGRKPTDAQKWGRAVVLFDQLCIDPEMKFANDLDGGVPSDILATIVQKIRKYSKAFSLLHSFYTCLGLGHYEVNLCKGLPRKLTSRENPRLVLRSEFWDERLRVEMFVLQLAEWLTQTYPPSEPGLEYVLNASASEVSFQLTRSTDKVNIVAGVPTRYSWPEKLQFTITLISRPVPAEYQTEAGPTIVLSVANYEIAEVEHAEV